MESEIKGTATFGFRVQDLSFDGVTLEEAEARIKELTSGLEALGATVVQTSYPRFEPDSPSVACTISPFGDEAVPVPVVTHQSVEDFLASSEERFNRFPVRSFWEALVEHTMLAHGTIGGLPPFRPDQLLYDIPDKKYFYVGMEPCECSLRGYGYGGLDPQSVIRAWKQWDDIRPGRLYKFGPRKEAFLGALASQLEKDLA